MTSYRRPAPWRFISAASAIAVAVAFVAGLNTPAAAQPRPVEPAPASQKARFDFQYHRSGAASILPATVFDDGVSTYLQWRQDASTTPAVFAVSDSGEEKLLHLRHEGAYMRVPGLYGRLSLVGPSGQRAAIVHARGSRDGAATVRVASGGVETPFTGQSLDPGARLVLTDNRLDRSVVDDAMARNSYATPAKGDRVAWTVGGSGADIGGRETVVNRIPFPPGKASLSAEAQRMVRSIAAAAAGNEDFLVIGHDDPDHQEGIEHARASALRLALVKAGVAAERITVRTSGATLKSAKGWDSVIEVRAPERGTVRGAQSGLQREPVRANIQGLLSAGVLTYEQAQAILRRQGAQLAAPDAELAQPSAARAPAPGAAPGVYTLSPEDRTMSGAIARWARNAGLTVVWRTPPELDPPITGKGEIRAGSVHAALEQVVRGMAAKGYGLEIHTDPNGTVLVGAPTLKPITQ